MKKTAAFLLVLSLASLQLTTTAYADDNSNSSTLQNIKDTSVDAGITTLVKSKLVAAKTKGKGDYQYVSVTTQDKVVNLSGCVNSTLEKFYAKKLAKTTKGVSKVDDENLEVNANCEEKTD